MPNEPRAPSPEPRSLWLLVAFGVFATLSVLYNPNAVHLAVVAPVFLVIAAESLERLLGARLRLSRPAGWALAALVAVAVAWQVRDNLRWQRSRYPFATETAFGRVDLQSRDEAVLLEILARELPAEGRREVFGYPMYAAIYPLAGAVNPTRFQVLLPGYSPPEHFDEVIRILEARRVPFVAIYAFWVNWHNDRLLAYINDRYERLALPVARGAYPRVALFRRKGYAGSGAPAAPPARR